MNVNNQRRTFLLLTDFLFTFSVFNNLTRHAHDNNMCGCSYVIKIIKIRRKYLFGYIYFTLFFLRCCAYRLCRQMHFDVE